MVNIDAFAEFSQILFFKIVSELAEAEPGKDLPIRWRDLENNHGTGLLELYQVALRELDKKYPGVFAAQVEIKNPATLERIIARLGKYSFLDMATDIKGDAYEHFLRQYNRQKNELAQYFTPRHVVAMMVGLADPKFGEKVYDPFCGTGGMLIESFRHMEKNMSSTRAADRGRLQNESVFGADISRSASTAKMNMILAGDGHSNIQRGDSLKADVRGKFDVVITNIPFVAADEKAFVRHCLGAAEGNAAGRVCMIVPERILDHPAYEDLRMEMLRDWTIRRVVSLPREVFRGVTSAKTSVIYALWGGARRKKHPIPYIKVENDGFTLDKKRDPLPGRNDLDEVIETRGMDVDGHDAHAGNHHTFKIAERELTSFKFPMEALRKLVVVSDDMVTITVDMVCREPSMGAKEHTITLGDERHGYNVRVKRRKLIRPGDLVFAKLHTQNGLFAYSEEVFHGTSTHLVCRPIETKIDRDFLFYALDKIVPTLSMEDTTGRENYHEDDILSLLIPLPPLDEQRKMAKGLRAAYQKFLQARAEIASAKDVFWRSLSG